MTNVQIIEQYMTQLGIAPEAAKVYLELSRTQSSVLQLAKILDMSRTQVYRHLESLQHYNLVSAEKLDHGVLYRPLPLESVEAIIIEREADLHGMRQKLDAMSHIMRDFVAGGPPQTVTRHFYGLAGVKQANWNLTKAKGEYRVFESAHLPEHLDESFARRFNARTMERELASYDITNKTSVDIRNLEPCDPKLVHYRHIDPSILNIEFEIYIYNDIVTLLDYGPENMQAIEIQNPMLQAMMRQMHQAMWDIGQPLTPS